MRPLERFLPCLLGSSLILFGLGARAIAQEPPAMSPAAPLVANVPPEGVLAEPGIISQTIRFITGAATERDQQNNGLYPEFSNMITGAGWISAGPGYRRWLFNDRAIVDGSAALSWRSYKVAQARFELPALARSRLAIGSQILWRDATQITFFGEGADSLDGNRSEYRMKTSDVTGYATVRPVKWLSAVARVGWLHRPTILPPAGSFKRGNPDTQAVFPDDPVFALAQQPNYLHGDMAISADTRDSRSHPYSGGLYRATVTAYSDRDTGAFSFRRYEGEAAQFVPLAARRVVLAAHGWIVASDTNAAATVPFYLIPSLGGGNTLRAYTDYRFHDRHLLVVNAEARVALFAHVDLAAFVDAGNVAARIADLNVDRRSYGVGVRVHTTQTTLGRMDIAHGADGWRVVFRTSDPLHLSRLSRRTAAAPFVP